jgi:hypothetical protein
MKYDKNMINDPPEEGDILTLDIKEENGKAKVVGVDLPYIFSITDDLGLDCNERRRVEMKVTDRWYTESGDIQRVFLEYHGIFDGDTTKFQAEEENEREVENPLSEVAERAMDDTEFKISDEEKPSSIGDAKREAMREQRDPAIDPDMNKIDSTDEDE